MEKLRVGDIVLVDKEGQLAYQPVLTFMHAVPGASGFVTVTHSLANESLRASASHLVFTVADASGSRRIAVPAASLQAGDWILADTSDGRIRPSKVLTVGRGQGAKGMFAPLTSSGSIIVDGVSASNYAVPSSMKWLSHSLAHAALFPVRAYHQLRLAALLQPLWSRLCGQGPSIGKQRFWLCQGDGISKVYSTASEDTHPFAALLWKGMPFDKLIPSLFRDTAQTPESIHI